MDGLFICSGCAQGAEVSTLNRLQCSEQNVICDNVVNAGLEVEWTQGAWARTYKCCKYLRRLVYTQKATQSSILERTRKGTRSKSDNCTHHAIKGTPATDFVHHSKWYTVIYFPLSSNFPLDCTERWQLPLLFCLMVSINSHCLPKLLSADLNTVFIPVGKDWWICWHCTCNQWLYLHNRCDHITMFYFSYSQLGFHYACLLPWTQFVMYFMYCISISFCNDLRTSSINIIINKKKAILLFNISVHLTDDCFSHFLFSHHYHI